MVAPDQYYLDLGGELFESDNVVALDSDESAASTYAFRFKSPRNQIRNQGERSLRP
jgi:hypothetical protein